LIVVGFRDLLIIGGYLIIIVLYGSVTVRPSQVSKLNTVLQLVLVTFIIVNAAGWFSLQLIIDVLIYAVLLTSVVSGVHYAWVWGIRRDFESRESSRNRGID